MVSIIRVISILLIPCDLSWCLDRVLGLVELGPCMDRGISFKYWAYNID
jgi:hypothetical protein